MANWQESRALFKSSQNVLILCLLLLLLVPYPPCTITHQHDPAKNLKLTPYLICIHLRLCHKTPFDSKWNSLVSGNIHRARGGGRWTLTLQYLMVPYYLYAIKTQTPQIWYVNLLRCHIWLPFLCDPQLHTSPPNHRAQGQSEHAQGHLYSASIADLRGGLAALGEIAPRKIPWSALVPCWKQNGKSDCPVSPPAWAIRLLCCWLPEPPQSFLSRECCHLLALLVLDYDLGLFALCRECSALLRVSQGLFFALHCE